MDLHRQLRFVLPRFLLGLFLAAAVFSPKLGDFSDVKGRRLSHWLLIRPVQAQTVQLINKAGWLEVERLQGQVSIQTSSPRPAQVGDRLTKSGDRLMTGPGSLSVLTLDHNIGSVQVAQNSILSVRQLGITRSGGWLTTLNLDQGQVRFRVNKEEMPRNSRFEVHSPSGVAGVRGTEFGVMLNPSSRMIIGTETGLVQAEANGEQVDLPANFGSAIFPEEPPLPPLRLDRDLKLDLQEVDYRQGRVWLSGNIYPLNTIFVNGTELAVSRTGAFEQQLPFEPESELLLRVANSIGDSQDYQLLGLGRDTE